MNTATNNFQDGRISIEKSDDKGGRSSDDDYCDNGSKNCT